MEMAVKVNGKILQLLPCLEGCVICGFYNLCKGENPRQDIQTWCQLTSTLSEVKGRRSWREVS